MRHLLIVAVMLAASAGATMAQDAPAAPTAAVIANPQWIRQPSRKEVLLVWPYQAELAAMTGAVNLQCGVKADGGLTGCKVLREMPSGFGFGKAALKLGPVFRMAPTMSDGTSVGGGTVLVPIIFRFD